MPRDLLQQSPLGGPLKLFRAEVVEEYSEWYEEQRRRFYQDRPPWRYLNLETCLSDGFVAMNWEGTSPLGIRRSFPFFHREILEFVFQVHPTELYGGGVKKILRRALHGLVPSRNLYRPDKGGWGQSLDLEALRTRKYPAPWALSPELFKDLLQPHLFRPSGSFFSYDEYRLVIRLGVFQEALYRIQSEASASPSEA